MTKYLYQFLMWRADYLMRRSRILRGKSLRAESRALRFKC